jgi:hypothetical protein
MYLLGLMNRQLSLFLQSSGRLSECGLQLICRYVCLFFKKKKRTVLLDTDWTRIMSGDIIFMLMYHCHKLYILFMFILGLRLHTKFHTHTNSSSDWLAGKLKTLKQVSAWPPCYFTPYKNY